jgi:hypothetical protein
MPVLACLLSPTAMASVVGNLGPLCHAAKVGDATQGPEWLGMRMLIL